MFGTMKGSSILVLAAYLVLSIGYLYALFGKKRRQEKILKCFLMPVLCLFYVFAADPVRPVIVWALIFGFIGDALLLEVHGIRFVTGLFAFLAGHVCYLIAFLADSRGGSMPPVLLIVLAIIYGFVAVSVLRTLWTGVETRLRPAIVLYMVMILAMSYAAFLRAGTLGWAFLLPWIGSVLFVISDSALGLAVFLNRKKLIVMPTYLLAQLLIVLGMI